MAWTACSSRASVAEAGCCCCWWWARYWRWPGGGDEVCLCVAASICLSRAIDDESRVVALIRLKPRCLTVTDSLPFNNTLRPLSHWKLTLKWISKFMLFSSFRKRNSSVNSQLSTKKNLFRNLEHVLFCEIPQKKFHLHVRSSLIGQSVSVYKHRTKRRLRRRRWLSKV